MINRCLRIRNTRRVAALLTSCCLALCVSAEVTPVPPGSTAQAPAGAVPPNGTVPPGGVVPGTPLLARPPVAPTTNPTLPRPQAIPAIIKTSPAPPQDAIDKYIKISVTRLMSDDSTAVTDARVDLIAAVTSPAPNTPCTQIYLNGYIAGFVKEIQPLLAKASLVKRLNIAIVIARIAENVNLANTGASLAPLHDIILGELNDKSDAVAVWGMKAVAQLFSPNQGGNPPAKIQNAILPSVKSHALSGPLTEDAYQALNAASGPFNIDTTMQLFKLRIEAYANGAVPPDPSVDRLAASHLTASAMWNKMAPEKKAQAMELIRRNIDVADAAIISPTASQDVVRDLRQLLYTDGAAVEVVSVPATNLYDDARQLRMAAQKESTQVVTLAEYGKKVVDGIPAAFPGGTAVAKP